MRPKAESEYVEEAEQPQRLTLTCDKCGLPAAYFFPEDRSIVIFSRHHGERHRTEVRLDTLRVT